MSEKYAPYVEIITKMKRGGQAIKEDFLEEEEKGLDDPYTKLILAELTRKKFGRLAKLLREGDKYTIKLPNVEYDPTDGGWGRGWGVPKIPDRSKELARQQQAIGAIREYKIQAIKNKGVNPNRVYQGASNIKDVPVDGKTFEVTAPIKDSPEFKDIPNSEISKRGVDVTLKARDRRRTTLNKVIADKIIKSKYLKGIGKKDRLDSAEPYYYQRYSGGKVIAVREKASPKYEEFYNKEFEKIQNFIRGTREKGLEKTANLGSETNKKLRKMEIKRQYDIKFGKMDRIEQAIKEERALENYIKSSPKTSFIAKAKQGLKVPFASRIKGIGPFNMKNIYTFAEGSPLSKTSFGLGALDVMTAENKAEALALTGLDTAATQIAVMSGVGLPYFAVKEALRPSTFDPDSDNPARVIAKENFKARMELLAKEKLLRQQQQYKRQLKAGEIRPSIMDAPLMLNF